MRTGQIFINKHPVKTTTRIHPYTQSTLGQVSGWGWLEATILTGQGTWMGDDEWAQMSTARGGWGQQTMGTRTLRIYKTNYLGVEGGSCPVHVYQAVHSGMRRGWSLHHILWLVGFERSYFVERMRATMRP